MSQFRAIRILGKLAAALVCLAACSETAAYTCNVSVTNVSVAFAPTVAVTNVMTGSYTITCTRQGGDPATLNWSLANDNGGAGAGGNNLATLGGNSYQYDTYRPGSLTNKWGSGAALRFTGQIVFGGVGSSGSYSGSFDVVVVGPQTVRPAGIYSDVVGVRLRNTNGGGGGTTIGANPIASFTVQIITSNYCQISVPPGNLDFTYTSFQVAASNANTAYGVRCTLIPYTMSLDATSGTLLGLNYTLSLPSPSATGTGFTQTFAINGSIAGSQAGTCATGTCFGSQTRTLTITY